MYFKKIVKSSGFSMTQVMIGMALTALVGMGAIHATSNVLNSSKFSSTMNDVSNITNETRLILSEPPSCFENFGNRNNITLNMNNVDGVPVVVTPQGQPTQIVAGNNIVPTNASSRLKMTSAILRPEAPLRDNRYIASLDLTFQTGQGVGSRGYVRRIPILARVNPVNNRITECSTTSGGNAFSSDILNRLCYITGYGQKIYNSQTGECVVISNATWISDKNGDQLASCSGNQQRVNGSPLMVCRSVGTVCNMTTLTRTYVDGEDRAGSPPCVVYNTVGNQWGGSCQCTYVTGAAESGFVASVKPGLCQVQCLTAPYSVYGY